MTPDHPSRSVADETVEAVAAEDPDGPGAVPTAGIKTGGKVRVTEAGGDTPSDPRSSAGASLSGG